MKLCVIIPAAGRSERFGRDDKLSTDLGGRAVLLRTIECFARRDEVSSIIVAGPPGELDMFKDRFGAALGFHGATIVEGGHAGRWETVKHALAHVPEDATHVAVHDAARPNVTDELLDRILVAAGTLPAVVPSMSLSSTIKRIDPGSELDAGESGDVLADAILGDAGRLAVAARPIEQTIDRTTLVAAQTPQVFQQGLLQRAYDQEQLDHATDDAQLVEELGETVHVVEGDPGNIKITTRRDLDLLRALLKSQPRPRPAGDPFGS